MRSMCASATALALAMDDETGDSRKLGRQRVLSDSLLGTACIAAVGVVLFGWRTSGSGMLTSIGFAALLVGGFVVPLVSKRRQRLDLARAAKERERKQWGFASRDREGLWINYVDGPVIVGSALLGARKFYSRWLVIHDGRIIVNPGNATLTPTTVAYDFVKPNTYAWDGCTPKRWFWWCVIVGTPDFGFASLRFQTVDASGLLVDKTVIWQRGHLASLVHDALSQYAHCVPLTRRETSTIFRDLLRDAGLWAPVRWVYYFGVRFLGPSPKHTEVPQRNLDRAPAWLASSGVVGGSR